MSTDAEIQKNVMEQLKYEPFLNTAQIGVSVKNGVVTLSGTVDSYSKKIGAELAAKKIAGVRAVAEELRVGPSPIYDRSDTEIAEAVLTALKWHTSVPEDQLKIKVENGTVTLEGQLDWNFQRESAVDAIKNLAGVRQVSNFITIRPKTTPGDIKQKITSALQRHAAIDSEKIKVELIGNRVILSGAVHSFAERDDAEHAAWSAPGIASVENRLTIDVREPVF